MGTYLNFSRLSFFMPVFSGFVLMVETMNGSLVLEQNWDLTQMCRFMVDQRWLLLDKPDEDQLELSWSSCLIPLHLVLVKSDSCSGKKFGHMICGYGRKNCSNGTEPLFTCSTVASKTLPFRSFNISVWNKKIRMIFYPAQKHQKKSLM